MIDPAEIVEQRRRARIDAPPPAVPQLERADAERRLRMLRGLAKDGHTALSISQILGEPVAAVLRDLPAALAAGRYTNPGISPTPTDRADSPNVARQRGLWPFQDTVTGSEGCNEPLHREQLPNAPHPQAT